jgi:hypothetical protein
VKTDCSPVSSVSDEKPLKKVEAVGIESRDGRSKGTDEAQIAGF